ncbi:TrkA family potassium uptake protein [Haloferax mediterranei ATCC 33500]|uniref:Potassium transporter Trk n=1 Tax=Haloferax mediterranei (strain ATCC 33500 / DSM 1411 / JCM 8866 / NBRC 14739 / NCIMB 2177 / R-4) TaxID=523841 RepID=I3R6U6_HALMT|nr:TrkA family potassium uptake protein [Haloferax mediterranei]AFK19956.1 TrkA domain-containing protein [Haloferax mediterranei ATCC 33500]AHZ23332.1 potassium transporter Trk [Haloferax mediterranei ATCC 33500]ELZ99500.1 TrkA domain-containing protein [Haloferax mediterranei ATCC 33500]MDX5987295.1 TrkA family potassium uptake protein [Haloferax mediterranei ATCC 33500]QCQ73815.1 TrkA family potassium uptake protein [Haloferax mediterranei ATCC 33500]
MRFVIIGSGRVGLRTARVLREEGHDIVLVELDRDRVKRAREVGFEVIEGDGAREDVLIEAGIEDSDALGALTADLNVNFAACMIAKHFDCRTVLRVDEDYREEIYQKYAREVDEIVYPERLGAIGAKNALLGGSIRAIADIAQHLQVILVTVTESSPMNGYSIEEVALPANSRLLAFGKKGQSMGIPLSDDSLETGDRVAVLADFDVLNEVRQLLVGDEVAAAAGGA